MYYFLIKAGLVFFNVKKWQSRRLQTLFRPRFGVVAPGEGRVGSENETWQMDTTWSSGSIEARAMMS